MLTYEEFSGIAMQISDHLTSFMELDRELANMGIAKAYDFDSASLKCQELTKSLSELHSHLLSSQNQQSGAQHLSVAIQFVDIFNESVNQLSHICKRLHEKANGSKYGWFEYRRDMKEYRRLETVRSSLGNQLNSAFRSPF